MSKYLFAFWDAIVCGGGRLNTEWTRPIFLETSVPGSFAAGDIRHGSAKRYATAVGEGGIAVKFVNQILEEEA